MVTQGPDSMEVARTGGAVTARARAAGLVVVLALGACGDPSPALGVQRCRLFEDVDQQRPGGGVPVAVSVPASWRRTDATDGSCEFQRADGQRIRVSLEICVKLTPCDEAMPSDRARTTEDLAAAGQILRTTTVKVADRVTGKVALCRASVQGAPITRELGAVLAVLAAPCDTLAIDR